MPEYDEAEIRGLIAASEIKAITIDASVIDGINRNGNLDHPLLRSIAKLRAKNVGIILSDVVARELQGHMVTIHDEAYAKLTAVLKSHTRVWKRDVDHVAALRGKLLPREELSEHTAALFSKFSDEAGIEIVSAKDRCDVGEIFNWYFDNRPPFGKADKKHEFPDAFALASIKSWADEHGAVLAVSKDKGWASFCAESEYLYCSDDLGRALALFYEDDQVVNRFIASLEKEPKGEAAIAVTDAIQRDLDDLDFGVNADAFMEWDAALESATVEAITYDGDPAMQRIVSADAESVTFLIPVVATIHVEAGFDFSVHDSIDQDYVSIGGTVAKVSIAHRYQVTVTVNGKGQDEIDIEDVTINPTTRLREVNFGHIEPFYEPEPDDW